MRSILPIAILFLLFQANFIKAGTNEESCKEPPLPSIDQAEYFTNMDKDREDFVANGHYYFCMKVINDKIDDFVVYRNDKVINHAYSQDYLIFCLGPVKSKDVLTNDFFVQYVYNANKAGKVKVSKRLYILSYYPGYEKNNDNQSFVLTSYY